MDTHPPPHVGIRAIMLSWSRGARLLCSGGKSGTKRNANQWMNKVILGWKHTSLHCTLRSCRDYVVVLTFEVEISVRRDHAASAACAIAIVARNVKHSLFSFRHRHHALIPAFYNLTHTNGKGERSSTVTACVELGAIGGKRSTECWKYWGLGLGCDINVTNDGAQSSTKYIQLWQPIETHLHIVHGQLITGLGKVRPVAGGNNVLW